MQKKRSFFYTRISCELLFPITNFVTSYDYGLVKVIERSKTFCKEKIVNSL